MIGWRLELSYFFIRRLRRYKNEEVAEIAVANNDILIPFASIDPAKGKMGAREDDCLISKKIAIKDDVWPKILKDNAARLLKLG